MALGGLIRSADYVRDSGERVQTLRVRLRASRKAANRRRWMGAGLVAAVGVSLAGLLAAGVVWCGRALFSRNARFAITRLDVGEGNAELASYLRDGKGIGAGANIFGFSIRRTQEDILESGPQYRSVRVTRNLPDTVVVRTVERVPIARIAVARRRLVVDQEGWVFGPRGGSGSLPLITGCDEYGMAPGRRVAGMASAAIEVLDVCRNPAFGLRVDSIDVSSSDHLFLQLEGRRPVKISWEGMGSGDAASRRNLEDRVERLALALRTSRAESHSMFDATYSDMIVGQ